MNIKKAVIISVIMLGMAGIPLGFNACGMGAPAKVAEGQLDQLSVAPVGPVVAGNGEKVLGLGALSVPTADAYILRVTNGLESQVSPVAGNFKSALDKLYSNLPRVSDPMKATGYDAAQLVTYAACSDLTTGATPKMKSVYNVDPGVTGKDAILAIQPALVAAGMRMLDQHTAGLASNGSAKVEVEAALAQLVKEVAEDTQNTNTTTVAFVSVCIAANTAGATLLSF